MKRNIIRDGFITGAAAVAATTAVLAVFGKQKTGSALAPVNSISHMAFGAEDADSAEGFSPQHTLTGFALHALSVGAWGVLYELVAGKKRLPQSLWIAGGMTAAIYLLDYYIVPERLKPGFERKLGNEAVAVTYTALALSLGLSPLWKQEQD